MIPCECTDTICICETTISSPDWRCTATDLPTECNKEGHHVHANICQCKLKQINELAIALLYDHGEWTEDLQWVFEKDNFEEVKKHLEEIKELSE